MHDPRGIPGPTDTRVGDVAFFVLVDIAKLDFESMMPPEERKKFKEEGVYAYHDFVAEQENRKWLQSHIARLVSTEVWNVSSAAQRALAADPSIA